MWAPARITAVRDTMKVIQEPLSPLRPQHNEADQYELDSLRELVVRAAVFGQRLFFENQLTELFWSDSHNAVELFPGVRRMMTQEKGGSRIIIQEPSRN